jgi:hypothetical protein
MVVFDNRWGGVMYSDRAMHGYGDIVVASKRPRDVIQANVVRSEARGSQCAESSTKVGPRGLVFSHV